MVRSFVARSDTRVVPVIGTGGELKSHNYVFFGEPAGRPGEGPQAFIAQTPAGRASHPHFHNVDQYQIFFPALGATYKEKAIDSILFHYADAFTAYGPYASGPGAPSEHLTLRARHSSVTAYVPEERDKLAGIHYVRRHVTHSLGAPLALDAGQTAIEALIDPKDDGLAAYVVQAGPHTEVSLPQRTGSGGQYCCLLDGSVLDGESEFKPDAVRWDAPAANADAGAFTAGASGMRVLVMRFPDPPTSGRAAGTDG
jgi:hypothetical protein